MKSKVHRKSARAGSQFGALRRKKLWPLLLLLVLLLTLLPKSARAQEGGTNRAGLIVVHGDGRVLTRCVTFTEERISGVALLQRSGLAMDANTGPMGSAVCTINREGCPINDCFCQCKGTPCMYWNYFHRNVDGSWAYSGMGAATWTVGNGDVDGWVWGDGSAPPPALAFDTICETESEPVMPAPVAPTVAATATTVAATATTVAATATTVAATATTFLSETPIPTPTLPSASPKSAPATPTAAPTAATAVTTSAPTSSPTPTATASSTSIPTADSQTPTPAATLSPTQPLTYTLSFPAIASPSAPAPAYRAPGPLLEYLPFVLLLISIVGLALLKRKR